MPSPGRPPSSCWSPGRSWPPRRSPGTGRFDLEAPDLDPAATRTAILAIRALDAAGKVVAFGQTPQMEVLKLSPIIRIFVQKPGTLVRGRDLAHQDEGPRGGAGRVGRVRARPVGAGDGADLRGGPDDGPRRPRAPSRSSCPTSSTSTTPSPTPSRRSAATAGGLRAEAARRSPGASGSTSSEACRRPTSSSRRGRPPSSICSRSGGRGSPASSCRSVAALRRGDGAGPQAHGAGHQRAAGLRLRGPGRNDQPLDSVIVIDVDARPQTPVALSPAEDGDRPGRATPPPPWRPASPGATS